MSSHVDIKQKNWTQVQRPWKPRWVAEKQGISTHNSLVRQCLHCNMPCPPWSACGRVLPQSTTFLPRRQLCGVFFFLKGRREISRAPLHGHSLRTSPCWSVHRRSVREQEGKPSNGVNRKYVLSMRLPRWALSRGARSTQAWPRGWIQS